MATVYLIQTETEGLPAFWDPMVGRNNGNGIFGWTQNKGQAIAFATARDAQKAIDALMPRTESTCRPVPHQRGD